MTAQTAISTVVTSHPLPIMRPAKRIAKPQPRSSTQMLNVTLKEKLGEDYQLKTYFGEEVLNIDEDTLNDLAQCYMTVFNESWGESWTLSSAKNEISHSLRSDPERIPLISLLYRGDAIIGFCWVLLMHKSAMSKEHDMPWELSDAEKVSGMTISDYWLKEVVKKDRIMFIKELGVLKEYRQVVSPFLSIPILERSANMGYDVGFLWTNVNSKAFKWGLGVGYSPVHFFITNNLLLMYGSVQGSLRAMRNVVEASFSKQSQYYMINNINKYLLKGEARN